MATFIIKDVNHDKNHITVEFKEGEHSLVDTMCDLPIHNKEELINKLAERAEAVGRNLLHEAKARPDFKDVIDKEQSTESVKQAREAKEA